MNKITKTELFGRLARGVFLWLELFYRLQKKENAFNRKKEMRWFLGGIGACIVVAMAWLSLTFDYDSRNLNVGAFVFLFVVVTILMNMVAHRRWRPRDFSKFLDVDKRISHNMAPDPQKGQFALAWTKKYGFIFYGYREKKWDSMLSAAHIALFGEVDQPQTEHVWRFIAQSWNHTPPLYRRRWLKPWRKRKVAPGTGSNTVVLCLDNDRAGLNFSPLRNIPGVVILDDDSNTIAGAILFLAKVIEDRASGMQSYGNTRILLITEDLLSDAFLGKAKEEFSHIQHALDALLSRGKDFGVHLIINANPYVAFESVRPDIRHFLMPIKFFTSAKYRVTKDGKTVEAKTTSPRYAKDQALVYYRGEFHESKVVYQPLADILKHARGMGLTSEASSLALYLADRNFPAAIKRKKPKTEPIITGMWREKKPEIADAQ